MVYFTMGSRFEQIIGRLLKYGLKGLVGGSRALGRVFLGAVLPWPLPVTTLFCFQDDHDVSCSTMFSWQ
jgi:hypothetical protein